MSQIPPLEIRNSLLDTLENDASLPGIRDPRLVADLRRHFWCDFSDLIPFMKWDDAKPN